MTWCGISTFTDVIKVQISRPAPPELSGSAVSPKMGVLWEQKGDMENPREDWSRARSHSATSQRHPAVLELLEVRGGLNRFSSDSQEDNPTYTFPPNSGIQDGEKTHSCCFQHPWSVGFCDGGPRTVNNLPRPPGASTPCSIFILIPFTLASPPGLL